MLVSKARFTSVFFFSLFLLQNDTKDSEIRLYRKKNCHGVDSKEEGTVK